MSLIGALDKTKHLSEFDEPLSTNEGWLSAATRKERVRANLGVGEATVSSVAAAGGAVTPTEGGGTYLIPLVTANVTMTLPAPTAGEKHKLVFVGSAADAEDWVITSPELFIGGPAFFDVGGTNAAVYADGATHNTLTVNNPAAGTEITFIGDGTNWAVTGTVSSADAPAFTAV